MGPYSLSNWLPTTWLKKCLNCFEFVPFIARHVQSDIHMRDRAANRPDTEHSEEAHQTSSPLMAASSDLKGNYDVFLSFRGTDVRNNFLGHLYAALDQKGIYTYIDSEELRKGEQITPALIKAIEDSRIAIIIFSEDYASSPWCLEEVEKIMESKEQRGLMVFPVFYKVEPKEVRTPRGSYREAMVKHKNKFGRDSEKVKRWEKALLNAGSLSGWELKDKDEADLIKRIVQEISMQLDRTPLHVAKHPVGIHRQVVKLQSMLNLESHDDVVMIGLWGQGGIGKTTLAKALYNDIFRGFEASCFLANVRETSKDSKDLVPLQEKLLSEILPGKGLTMSSVDGGINLIQDRLHRKKILLVLDDVNDIKQLNALAGECKWFGKGSRIIITTRDNHLLTTHWIDKNHIHEVETLKDGEALELFNKHAFPRSKEIVIRRHLVDSALHYANGLPLALEVLGSFLCGRKEREWKSALNKLAKSPNKTINDVLKLSYDGLEKNEKEIFLDMACFFKGRSINYVMNVLNGCGFDAIIGVQVLVEKSLITKDGKTIQMHDLIQMMGMDIVKQECCDDPGRRSRLWLYEDVHKLLSEDMGTNAVKAIVLILPKAEAISISPNAFTNMRSLRLLIMINVHISFQDRICLPNELRWLEWPECPSWVLKFSSGPKNLVGLDLRKSNIEVIVDQFKDFKNLKFLYFSECLSMVCMPNLDLTPNLEELDLYGCKNLERAHESVAYHAKLRWLNLKGCSNLHHLPDVLQSKNLQLLNLTGCSKLERFPDILNKMKCLQGLFLKGTSIEELPASIENLVSLEKLSLIDCKKLTNLPSSIYKLPNLVCLLLDGCSKLIKFPKKEEDLSDLINWEMLTEFRRFHWWKERDYLLSTCRLEPIKFPKNKYLSDQYNKTGFPSLRILRLGGCNLLDVEFLKNRSCFPSLISLDLSKNNFAELPTCWHLSNLHNLDVSDCRQLQEIGDVSETLLDLQARNCESLSKISSDILCIDRFYRGWPFLKRDCNRLFDKIFLPGGEMPQWLLPNKEGYISFTASKDLYEKFKELAICVVFREKGGKRNEFKFISYINGSRRSSITIQIRSPGQRQLHSDYVYFKLLQVWRLWVRDPFGPNHSSSFQLVIKASAGAIVKKCGFGIIWANEGPLNGDEKSLDPGLFHDVGHHYEERTPEEEISADLSDVENQRWVNHEDNYQTSSEEDDDMDNSPRADIMADFSVERWLEEDMQPTRLAAHGTSDTETDDDPLDDVSWCFDKKTDDETSGDMSCSDLSVEKFRYSEISSYYMDILPGGDMPEEFVIVEGNAISFTVSQDFYDKFLGLALCVVFTIEDGEKEIFFDIMPHLNGHRRNGLSGSLGSFNSNHMWIQYLKPNVLWGVLEGAVDFLEFDEDCLLFSLTLNVLGGTIKKLGYVLRCKQMDDDLKVVLEDKQLVNPASIYEMKFKEFFYKFLPRQMERVEARYGYRWQKRNRINGKRRM